MKYRKWLLLILISLFVFSFTSVFAKKNTSAELEVKIFYSQSCPHCASARAFLSELDEKRNGVSVKEFGISQNIELLKELYEEHEVPSNKRGLVPAIFIDGEYFIGFNENIGSEIEECINQKIEGEGPCEGGKNQGTTSDASVDKKISLPLLGEINTKDYSLPTLAVLLGFLDGFNVCSLGALILILGLVLSLRSRSKTLFFGGIFVITTSVIYGLLIVLWYKLFSVLSSYVRAMEMLIGILGVGGGLYFFWQFLKFRKQGPTCEMGQQGIVSMLSSKVQEAFDNPKSILGLGALILLFAAVIAIVEFPCSAALPVIFAGILANSELSTFLYLLYIAIFVLFYMLDEVIVFLGAFFSMKLWLTSPKFITWATLVEALFLLGLGAHYLGIV